MKAVRHAAIVVALALPFGADTDAQLATVLSADELARLTSSQ